MANKKTFKSKNISLAAGVLAVVAVVLVIYLGGKKPAIDEILPEGALLYARYAHAQEDFKALSDSPFWQRVKHIDVIKLLEVAQARPEQIASLKDFNDEFVKFKDSPLLEKLLGREFAVAVYPFEGESLPEKIQSLLSNIVFVTRLSAETRHLDDLIKSLPAFQEDISFSDEVYQKQTVTHVVSSKDHYEFYYTKIRNYLVISTKDRKIREVIDVAKDPSRSLSRLAKYRKAKDTFYPEAHGVFYLDADSFMQKVKAEVLDRSDQPVLQDELLRQQLQEAFRQFEGFEALASSTLPSRKTIKANYCVLIDPARLSEQWKNFYSCLPAENKTLSFIPKDVVGYQWGNCYDFQNYWQQLNTSKSGSGPISSKSQEMLKSWKTRFGLNFEQDVLPVLGKEVGGYLQSIDTQGFFPLPKLLLFLKVNDLAAAQSMVDKLLTNPFALLKTEDYGGSIIHYLSLPFGADFDPGYCFIDDYFLLASSRQVLKNSLDAAADPDKNILSNEELKASDFPLSQPNNSVFIVRSDKLAGQLKNLLEWGNNWYALKLRQAEASREQVQAKLDEMRQEIPLKEQEREGLLVQLQELRAVDGSEENPKLQSVEIELTSLKTELESLKSRESELSGLLASYDQQVLKSGAVKFYINEIVIPVLYGLEAVSLQAVRGQVHPDHIATEMIIRSK